MAIQTTQTPPVGQPATKRHVDCKAMPTSDTQGPRPGSPEAMGRSSFSSVRENDDGLAQTFTSTKVSSYAQGFEEAVDDSSSMDRIAVEFRPPVTQPFSKLHGSWYPASSFKGWKHINVQGKTKTRSFGDLQTLRMMWNAPPSPVRVDKNRHAPGGAPLEKLPTEVLGKMFYAYPSHCCMTTESNAWKKFQVPSLSCWWLKSPHTECRHVISTSWPSS